MSTLLLNTIGTTSFSRMAGDGGALQSTIKWGGAYGTGVALTFSFPNDKNAFISPYGDLSSSENKALFELTAVEKAAVRDALAEWAAVANISFTEVGDGLSVVGDLRFAVTDNAGHEAAHAYYPGDYPEGGDVWFRNGAWHDQADRGIAKGSYDYLTILHEIGHAIGLKHSFEGPGPKIGKAFDSYAYTIMSYSASPDGDGYASFYPTTPMYFDLVAIQGMYGRGVHNPGDNVYAFGSGNRYWQTIDDSGGIDTIVHEGKAKAVIDLNVGHWSDLGKSIEFSSGSMKWTVMIGPETLIENATGGRGEDKLIGNDSANVLAGGSGKDKLTGGGGSDTFVFGAKLKKGNRDKIKDFAAGEDLIQVDHKLVKALDTGAVTAAAFSDHFTYKSGKLSYDGKQIAKLGGAPDIDHHDLFVV
jgi:serralysin